MRTTCLIAALALLLVTPALALSASSSAGAVSEQQQGPGRGDDLVRIRSWRSFLTRADRAFFAARMNTEAVRAKIAEADTRIEELEAAPKDDKGGRSDITGDVAFLERAQRAFTAARMNTADVQKWLREAREGAWPRPRRRLPDPQLHGQAQENRVVLHEHLVDVERYDPER